MMTITFMMNGLRRPGVVGLMLVLCGVQCLAACSSEPAPTGPPTFSGPWEGEFESSYAQAVTDRGRAILADGVITDEENSEVKVAFVQCLEAKGYTEVEQSDSGAHSHTTPVGKEGDDDADYAQCDHDTDWTLVGSLHRFSTMNPSNEDPWKVKADCLVRVGVAPEGYSSLDYERDFLHGEWDYGPWDADNDPRAAGFIACNDDPVHAGR